MLEDGVVVPLKRKVRSLETNLLEWRRCACTFTSDSSQLILELTDDDVDDVVLDDDGDASGDGTEDTGRSRRPGDDAGDREVDVSRRRGKCRVAIDLGSALKRIEQKRKNKTRCEIEYWESAGGNRTSTNRRVRTEELMASSAKHCQQFIDQVREAERQAKRTQSIRLGAVLAAASTSGVSSSHASSQQSPESTVRAVRSGSPSQISPPKIKTEHFRLQRGVAVSIATSVSAKSSSGSVPSGGALRASALSSSGKSEEISPAVAATTRAVVHEAAAKRDFFPDASFHSAASIRDQHQRHHQEPIDIHSGDQQTQYWSQHCHDAPARDCESDTLDSSSGVISPRATPPPVTALYRDPSNATSNPNLNIINNSLASSRASCSSVSTVSKILLASKPLPQELFAQRLASLRSGAQPPPQHQHQQESDDDADDDDDDDDESFDNRRRARMEKLFSPGGASSSRRAFQTSRVIGRRRPSVDLRAARERSASKSAQLLRSSAISRRRNSGSPASAAALAANLNRLRLQSRNNINSSNDYGNDRDRDCDDNAGDSSNRAELHILMRVEAALRQLEKENALAKEREALLAQEVQSLRDALRVKSAEKKHVETQFQQLLREKDEWKQVAQRTECAVVQIEDELLIAREEAQLLQSERVRLKHQNKELLTHVHRLDSLVYGRF